MNRRAAVFRGFTPLSVQPIRLSCYQLWLEEPPAEAHTSGLRSFALEKRGENVLDNVLSRYQDHWERTGESSKNVRKMRFRVASELTA